MFINPIKAQKLLLSSNIDANKAKQIHPGSLGRISAEHKFPVVFNDKDTILFHVDAYRKLLSAPTCDVIFALSQPKSVGEVAVYDCPRKLFKRLSRSQKRSRAEKKAISKKIRDEQSARRYQNHREGLSAALGSNTITMFLDVEWYERSKGRVTEIGYTLVENCQFIHTHHIVITDNLNKRNGRFVPDNKDNFEFGKSTYMTLAEAMEHLRQQLVYCDHIMGHGVGGDITVLTNCLGKKHRNSMYSMFEGKTIVDTSVLSKGLSDRKSRMSLERCLDFFGIEHRYLHNAGNDTHYNWLIAERMVA